MIKLGKLTLNGIPRVAVSIKDSVAKNVIKDIEKYGVDIIELRIDQYASFQKEHVLDEVKKFKHFPTIATIRCRQEGGSWHKSEDERLELFKAVIPHVHAIDIELSSMQILPAVIKEAHRAKKIVIISYHNFDKTPDIGKLKKVFKKSKKFGADIVKIATLILKPQDMQQLAAFTIANAYQNIVTIGMGSFGANTRVLFPGLGSLITYAYIGEPAAPGQFDYRTTFDLMRKLYPKYNEAKISSRALLKAV